MEKVQAKYLAALRDEMAKNGIHTVIISGTDPHQSENPPAHWRDREWLTGFWSTNGTNGTAVVTPDKALCWTDSRYFLQAEEQLQGTGFSMMEEDGPNAVDLVDWVTENTPGGSVVAIDGTTFSIAQAQRMEQNFSDNNIVFKTDFCPFDTIHPERPATPDNKLFVHDEKIVGETVDSKVERVLAEVKGELANAVLLSSLDDIAWGTNLRTAGDIAFSPIFVSYLYLSDEMRVLFVDPAKLTDEVREHLEHYSIATKMYNEVFDFVKRLPKAVRLLIDPEKTSRTLYDSLGCTPVFGGAGVARLKSIKNESMLSSLDRAMEKDGVALTRFFMMVEKELPAGKLTEVTLARRLREIRLSDPDCVDESFASIIGFNGHGAIVHYEPTPETDVTIEGNGLLLVDSGGQYKLGTTDITRTVAVGTPTAAMKHDFTLVMKGHIALARAVFPEDTTGHQLDVLARQYLWQEGKAYYHGTGHGVGFFINCHEGPQNIRLNANPTPLQPGMITSNEPGLYLADRYGIRCENLIETVPAMTTEFGSFLKFRTATLFPFDLTLFDTSIMSDDEIEWVNDYHAMVRARLLPLLDAEEADWMTRKTHPLTR
ncbi:MAG: aminopeptidase P family protein [Muribaculaceae bacterium]|nr:aminopeptidase P family protein [Muribaculaceae bacterium]